MSKDDKKIISKYLENIKLLQNYDKFYYDKDNPLVSDHKYDEIKNLILQLENDYSILKKYNSIIPCGITNRGVTNLKKINNQNYNKLVDTVIKIFTKNLEIQDA